MYNLGLVLKEQGRTEAAFDTLYRATWNYTYNSGANYQLAQMYSARSNYEMALERLDEAIDYNGRNYHAINMKGAILDRLGKKREAADCFGKVLSEDPVNAYAIHRTASAADFHIIIKNNGIVRTY